MHLFVEEGIIEGNNFGCRCQSLSEASLLARSAICGDEESLEVLSKEPCLCLLIIVGELALGGLK